MATVPRPFEPEPSAPPGERLSPVETALYTRDVLENLRKTAEKQGQTLLSHLLELAGLEAKFLSLQSQPTRLPR
ncbi:MAG TPA: hypothetical protein VIJ72_00710 [Rhizomicrobium sp.]